MPLVAELGRLDYDAGHGYVVHLRIVARRLKGKEKSIATTNYGDGSLEDVESVIHVEPALFERGPAGAVQR